MKLTEKQKKFCDEYLVDLNATQAYIRAGYKDSKAAEVSAHHLLRNPKIEEYINSKQEEVRDRNGITVDFIVNGIKDIALLGEQENNRLKAFDMLGKHLGIYAAEKIEHSGEVVKRTIIVNPTKKKDE